jgi:hypothetical protein
MAALSRDEHVITKPVLRDQAVQERPGSIDRPLAPDDDV